MPVTVVMGYILLDGYAAYRLTEDGWLEILGRDHKIIENYFLFDGEHYYFNNQLVQATSDKRMHKDLILAMTDTKLLIPQENEDYLYIARNHMANKDLLVVVLYYYDDHIHYTVVSGNGSGRVHPIYLPLTEEGFKFCFHFTVEAIAAVKPALADTLFASLKQKCEEAEVQIAGDDKQTIQLSSLCPNTKIRRYPHDCHRKRSYSPESRTDYKGSRRV